MNKNLFKLAFVLVLMAASLAACGDTYPVSDDEGQSTGEPMRTSSLTPHGRLTWETPVPSGGSRAAWIRQPDEAGQPLSAPVGPIYTLSAPLPLFPVSGAAFEGFGYTDNITENNNFVFIPPDSMGAAGPDRLIATVNRMIEARNKTGTLLWRDSLKDFFSSLVGGSPGVLGTRPFDPKVVYDPYENRFVVVALELTDINLGNPTNASRILLAVSRTSSPGTATAADWHYLAIDSKLSIGGIDRWADFPGFEIDEEAVYITTNMFAFGGFSFGGVRLWVLDKGVSSGFYAGGAASVTVQNPIPSGMSGITTAPCQVFGPGGVGVGIGTFFVGFDGLSSGANERIQVIRMDSPLSSPTFTGTTVLLGNIDLKSALLDAPQSGTTTLIKVNDRRVLDCVWRGGKLWMVTTIKPISGTDLGQTTAHWIRLDTSAITSSSSPVSDVVLDDQGDIGGEEIASGTYTFFPSVAVNSAGAAQFGFSASAPTIFAGAFVTGRETGDAAGTVQTPATVKAGEDFYVRTLGGADNRWGDYSGISIDPVDDSFWVFNAFADIRETPSPGKQGRWGTAWANVAFSASVTTTTTAITATSTTTTTTTVPITGTTTITTTTTTTMTPSPPPPPAPKKKKRGCFIATAAYGSTLDPHVQTLRIFRDHVLLQSSWGRAFVNFYDEWSPPMADVIRSHEGLRTVVRWGLTPIVYGVAYPQISLITVGMIGVSLAMMLFLRRRL